MITITVNGRTYEIGINITLTEQLFPEKPTAPYTPPKAGAKEAKSAESEKATPNQQGLIHGEAERSGWKDYELKALLDNAFGVTSTKDLSKKQASAVIDFLKAGRTLADVEQLKTQAQ